MRQLYGGETVRVTFKGGWCNGRVEDWGGVAAVRVGEDGKGVVTLSTDGTGYVAIGSFRAAKGEAVTWQLLKH